MLKKSQPVLEQKSKPKEIKSRSRNTKEISTPANQYNLVNYQQVPRTMLQVISNEKSRSRSSKRKLKEDSELYQAMNAKLESIELKIQEMKATIHKKKLEREKNNTIRNQELQALKKKMQASHFWTESPNTREKQLRRSETEKQLVVKKNPDEYEISKKIIQKKSSLKLLPQPAIENEYKPQQQLDNKKVEKQKQQSVIKEEKDEQNQCMLAGLLTQEKIKCVETQKDVKQEKIIDLDSKLKLLITTVPEGKAHTFDTNPYSPRSSIYYVSEVVKGYADRGSIVYDHIRTSIDLFNIFSQVRLPNNNDVKKRGINLPQNPFYEGKKTIIFDLDETLIHCNESLKIQHEIELPIKFPTGEIIKAGINIRPGAVEILENLYKDFQLMVFTASQECYANVVINHLDPERKYIQHRLYREHCSISPKGMYVKDLRVINRQLKNMVLIDNAAYSYAFQPENGIPIIPYFHGKKDFQLKALTQYLRSLQNCPDVRKQNRQTFRLTRYRDYKPSEVEKLVEDLYVNRIQ